jgi:methanogenic corrinoid protein MtbC1
MDGRDQALNQTAAPPPDAEVPEPKGIAGLAARVVARLVDRDGPALAALREDLVVRFMESVLVPSPGGIEALFADLRRAGVSRTAFADRYIPEIARRLGTAWEDDTLGFAEVSVGMSRLQAILREIGRDWSADCDPKPVRGAGTVLLIIPDREQHTLGAMVVMGLLRRRGVSVAFRIGPDEGELRSLLAEASYDAALLSVGQASGVAPARVLVTLLKQMTRGRIPVVVGGAVLGIMQDVQAQTGADLASNDLATVMQTLGLERAAAAPLTMRQAGQDRE